MKMTLAAALAALDVANDDHWTQEGLPRLDVLKELTGKSVARSDLSPAFTRESQQPASLDETDAPDDLAELDDKGDSLEDELNAANAAVDAFAVALSDATVEYKRLMALRDEVVRKIDIRDAKRPNKSWEPIGEYLASEARKREARAKLVLGK